MPIQPTSFDNIKVGYISQTDGYVKDVSIASANAYEKSYPNTEYIFISGDNKVVYLDINGVNALTPKSLLRSDPCDTTDKPCGPPVLKFFGGHGVGAAANPVIDRNGQLIAADLINGGGGYKSPPQVQVIDPCKNGTGALLQTIIKDGVVIKVIVKDTGLGYLPPAQTTPQYPAVLNLTEVRVKNPGFNYNCGVDNLTITPSNGTVLSYKCDPFGKIKSVSVDSGGSFTELPNIGMDTETGFNASFIPVFEINRDPEEVRLVDQSQLVQVYDLVGLTLNGYVDGKAYYGNVYFVGGVKYAGTTTSDGTDIQVYDTRLQSIENTTVEKLQ